MNVNPAPSVRSGDTTPTWAPTGHASSVAAHAGVLDGATLTGEAARRHMSIRVGLWLDDAGRVRRARWRASGDDALRAGAEAACSLVESGLDPLRLDAAALRTALGDAGNPDVTELVASALHAALLASGLTPA